MAKGFVKRKAGSSYYSNKKYRPVASTGPSPQNRAMQFVPRSLGNPLSYTERKFWDTVVIDRIVPTVGTTFSGAMVDPGTQNCLFTPITGAEMYNRISRKVYVKKISISGRVTLPALSNLTTIDVLNPMVVRVILCIDKQTNGAAPTYSDIIKSQNISGTTSSKYTDMINLDNRDRFEILRDMFIQVGKQIDTATQAYAIGNNPVTIDEYIRLGNRETVYNAGSAGTVGDITSGALYVFMISNQVYAQGAGFEGTFRTRFLDT